MKPDPQILTGWGRHPKVPGREVRSPDLESLTEDAVLTRGLARSYGDSSLPPPDHPQVAATPLANRILRFDAETGILRAEAGLSLAEMNRLFLPRGWFTPVTPGTRFVTLGGMVAADVHGKNHHVAGTFGRHVRRLRIRLAPRGGDGGGGRPGPVVTCSPEEFPELFYATLGGMGLTGHILEVEVALERVPSPWILAETERFPSLGPFLEGLERASRDWPLTVGWIDALATGAAMGRGILHRGRWAEPAEAPAGAPSAQHRLPFPPLPVELPSGLLSRPSILAFNALYWHRHPAGVKRHVTSPESFFYPLDAIEGWNRLYGARGFTQYQCVLPKPGAAAKARRFLELFTSLSRLGSASFLCVLKDCGEEGEGILSFPKPGISLALDLPVGRHTQELVDRLNERVLEEGGRIYLAKDAFTRPEHFRRMEGERLERFQAIRREVDPDGWIRSAQSVRLFGDSSG